MSANNANLAGLSKRGSSINDDTYRDDEDSDEESTLKHNDNRYGDSAMKSEK